MGRILIALLITSLTCGCANWSDLFRTQNWEQSAQNLLKKSQMSDDSVVLEISIVSVPADQQAKIDELFQTLDITRIELNQRKAWDRNGLRVAAGGNTMPMEYEQILSKEVSVEDNSKSTDETKLAPRRRIQARSGKPFRIATRSVTPELTWFTIKQDGYRHGGSKANAQPEFEVRSFSKGDGSVKLLIKPEILYGDPKQTVTTSNASLRYEMKRDSVEFPDLRLETVLHLGESLVMSAGSIEIANQQSGDIFGLGQAFFEDEQSHRKLVVIRLAQSQRDDLFDNSQNSQPLESITE